MKNYFIICLLAIGTLISCDNELDINAPYENISAVYGILDQSSDTNWVRIHRGFLGTEGIGGGNNNPDSIYYQNIVVFIEEIDQNNTILNKWPLVFDDTKTLDSGYWTTQGYYLFRLDQTLNDDYSYKVVIEKSEEDGGIVTAQTPLVNSFNITRPRANENINFGASGEDFNWDQAKNAILYQAYLRFHYVEISIFDAGDSNRYWVDYRLPTKNGNNLNGNDPDIINNISYATYFRFLQNSIEEDDTKIRFYRGMDMHVVAAAEDLATYINVSQPAQGIVQDKPLFTNVDNGVGIFSSSTSQSQYGMDISKITLDSLVIGQFTCFLNFAKTSQADTCQCLIPGQIICN